MKIQWKTYEFGAEWHYLSDKHARAQGGHRWRFLYGFDFHALTSAEQKRYLHIYRETMRARGASEKQIDHSIARLKANREIGA